MTNRGPPRTSPNSYGSSHVTTQHRSGYSHSYQNDFQPNRGGSRGGGGYRSHGPATRGKSEWTPSPGSKNQQIQRQNSRCSGGDSLQYRPNATRQTSPVPSVVVSNQNVWSPEKPNSNYNEHGSWAKSENPWGSKKVSRNREDSDLTFEIRGSDMKISGKDNCDNGMPEYFSNECGFREAATSQGANDCSYFLNKSDSQTKMQSANEVSNELTSSSGTRRVTQNASNLKSVISSSIRLDEAITYTICQGPLTEKAGEESYRGVDIRENGVAEAGDSIVNYEMFQSVESESLLSSSSTSQCNQSSHFSRGSQSPTPEAMLLNSDIDIEATSDSPPCDDNVLGPEDLHDFVRCFVSNDSVLFNPSANVGLLPAVSQIFPKGACETQNFAAPPNDFESLSKTDVGENMGAIQREMQLSGDVDGWRDPNRGMLDEMGGRLNAQCDETKSDSRPPAMSFRTALNSALNQEPTSSSPKNQRTSAWQKKSSENDFIVEKCSSAISKRNSEPLKTSDDAVSAWGFQHSKRGEDFYKTRKSASPNPWKEMDKSRGLLGDSPDDSVNQLSERVSNLDTRSQEEKRTQLRREQMFGSSSFARSMEKSGSRGTGKVKFVKATALTQHFVNPQQKSLADRLQDMESQSPQTSSANIEEWGRNFKSLYSLKNTSNQSYIDSHCHIDFLYKRYNLHKDCTLKLFNEKHFPYQPESFEGFVSVYCEPYAFQSFKSYPFLLEERGVNCVAAFGIHPHSAHLYNDKIEKELLIALDHPKCTALGEIGLDYSDRASEAPIEIQKTVFIQQLKLALSKRKNVVLHCRDADHDMNEILKKYAPGITMHRHCFTENRKLLGYLLKTFPNMYIGFTNLISLRNADDPRQAAYEMPLDRLLLETDAPYFLPPSVPTKYSHPAMAVYVAEKIAEIKNTRLDTVMRYARENTRRMYNI